MIEIEFTTENTENTKKIHKLEKDKAKKQSDGLAFNINMTLGSQAGNTNHRAVTQGTTDIFSNLQAIACTREIIHCTVYQCLPIPLIKVRDCKSRIIHCTVILNME